MTTQSLRWLGLCAVLSAICTGCVIIPYRGDYHDRFSRTNVREETTISIIPGRTTRENILLDLGEPDEVSADGSHLVYRWTKANGRITKAFVAFAPIPGWPGGGSAGIFEPKDEIILCLLSITFDERGVVLHRRYQEQPLKESVSLILQPLDVEAKRFSPPPEKANIYITRTSRFIALVPFQVHLDDNLAGSIAWDTYLLVEVEPGTHQIAVVRQESQAAITITARSGGNYFVDVVPKIGWRHTRVALEELREEEGRKAVQNAKRAEPLGVQP